MADKTLGDIIEDVSSEDGVRKVEVEITHKHEDSSGSRSWTIALAMTVIIAGALIYAADSVKEFAGGDEAGPCGDGIDNDNGGKMDQDDPDCYSGTTYDSSRSETDGNNDHLGRP